jgi:hypothetical protein
LGARLQIEERKGKIENRSEERENRSEKRENRSEIKKPGTKDIAPAKIK